MKKNQKVKNNFFLEVRQDLKDQIISEGPQQVTKLRLKWPPQNKMSDFRHLSRPAALAASGFWK